MFKQIVSVLISVAYMLPVSAFGRMDRGAVSIYEKINPAIVTVDSQLSDGLSCGTGCIIDKSGIILTSAHVIDIGKTVVVTMNNGQNYNARVLKHLGENKDIALLKIDADKDLKTVKLGNSEKIKVGEALIDGKSSDDIGELVIKDREMLSENGIVLISATISKQDKVLLVGPEVTTRGFIYVKDSTEMIKEIKRISEAIIDRNTTPNYVDFNKIKTEIRDELSKYLYEETECKPMIIAVVQEV